MSTSVLEKQETKKVSELKSICSAPIAVYENGESFIVLLELPGVDEKEVQVRLDKGILTIEAPLKLELPDGAVLKYSEVRFANYRRTLNVGDQVDEDKIAATFKAGLLQLTMAKSKGAKARKVPIKTA